MVYKNKNADTIQSGTQKILRIQHNESLSPMEMKLGTIIGETFRVSRLTIRTEDTCDELARLQMELTNLDYNKNMVWKAIHHIIRHNHTLTVDNEGADVEEWHNICDHFYKKYHHLTCK